MNTEVVTCCSVAVLRQIGSAVLQSRSQLVQLFLIHAGLLTRCRNINLTPCEASYR